MTLAFGIGNAQLFEPAREMLSRVVGDDEERRCAGFVVYGERRRLVTRQQTIQRVIHLRPVSLAWVVIGVAFVRGVGKSSCRVSSAKRSQSLRRLGRLGPALVEPAV